jgi:hypothetical protein
LTIRNFELTPTRPKPHPREFLCTF